MKLALIGGGGLAKEVAEVAGLLGHDVAGFYADTAAEASWPYLGPLDRAHEALDSFQFAFCIGAVNAAGLRLRRTILSNLKAQGLRFAELISPHAVVSAGVRLGEGVYVAHGVVLSVDAQVGDFCLINTSAVVGHDAKLADNVILAPLAFLGGHAEIGPDVLVGPHASVLENRKVAERSVVGTGAVVHRDTRPDAIVMPQRSRTL